MKCREHCGICCIIPAISKPYKGMPDGRPAGTRCVHLTTNMRCAIYHSPEKPKACSDFQAEEEFCGKSREEAIKILAPLENLNPDDFLGKI